MKIQLVKPPIDFEGTLDQKWFAPLGLISLGTYLEEAGHDVEILDGQHLSLDEIKGRLDAPVVGSNFHIFSVNALDEIVTTARDRGSIVVVGGQAATPLSEQLLRNNDNIDVVVRYDGEEALRQIAERRSRDFRGIPNTVYFRDGKIVHENIELLDLESLPVPNRRIKGIDLEAYTKSWSKEWDKNNEFRPTSVITKRGCPRRCSFCGRIDKKMRKRTTYQAFMEYKMLTEEFNVNYLYELNDTNFYDKKWMREFRQIYDREGGLNAKFWAFADVRDIDEEVTEHMQATGVYMVCLGIESGNEAIRRLNNKNFTNEQVLEACALLGKYGIKVSDAYVLGLMGETQETLIDTHVLSQQVKNVCETEDTAFSNITPLPGSIIWERMMDIPELQAKYGNEYKFDIKEMRQDYLANFCKL